MGLKIDRAKCVPSRPPSSALENERPAFIPRVSVVFSPAKRARLTD